MKFCILNGSYERVDGQAVLQYYGRSDDGRSAMVRVHGFKPYFHARPMGRTRIEAMERFCERSDVVLKYRRISRKIPSQADMGEQTMLEMTLTAPWELRKFRTQLLESCGPMIFYSADILFHLRYIYDAGLGTFNEIITESEPVSTGYTKDIYGVDVVLTVNADEVKWRKIDPFPLELKMLAYDIEALIRTKEQEIICIGWALWDGDSLVHRDVIAGFEGDILEQFEDVVKRHDPDIICSHYNDYDMEKIEDRAHSVLKRGTELGRDRSGFIHRPSSAGSNYQLHGRVVADSVVEMKTIAVANMFRPQSFTLDYLSKLILKDEKKPLDASKIDDFWETQKDFVLEYCEHDAYLSGALILEVGALGRYLAIANCCSIPLAEAMSKTSNLIDGLVIPVADREGWAIPMTRRPSGKKEKIKGAYVHDPTPGVHHMVLGLDFKSLYPSEIIDHNICFTSKRSEESGSTQTSPIGAIFDQSVDAIIPRIMKDQIRRRGEVKKVMNQYEKGTPEWKYYDSIQYGIKAGGTNSFYGVLASDFYRFTDPEIGESITQWGAERTKGVIRDVGENYTELIMIYGDTDSTYIQVPIAGYSPEEALALAVAWGQMLSEKYTAWGVELELEKIYNPLFMGYAKKRYVGDVIWPKKYIDIKGFETQRSDSFDAATGTLREMFAAILRGEPAEATRLARRKIRGVLDGVVSTGELILSKGVREFDNYADPGAMVQVQAAKKLILEQQEFIPGGKVSWIVTHDGKQRKGWKKTTRGQKYRRDKGIEVEPVIEGRDLPTPYKPYYAERLAAVFGRITMVFNDQIAEWERPRLTGNAEMDEKNEERWIKKALEAEMKNLLHLKKQTTLFSHEQKPDDDGPPTQEWEGDDSVGWLTAI